MTDHESKEGREALLASMRRTLLMMRTMGVPGHVLLDILELSAKELRELLAKEENRLQ
jgi:hypothetical protein